jgi:hypothetical protein
MTGLLGLLTELASLAEPLLKGFLSHEVAERADEGDTGVFAGGCLVTNWSSKLLGEFSVFLLILLPMVRSRTPQISTVTT